MKNYPTWKWIIVLVSIILAIVFCIPTFIYQDEPDNWFLENKINLGLDLQGGSYLLLEVESEVLFKEELENFSDTIRLLSRENKVKINDINANNDNLNIRFESSEKLEIIRKKLNSKDLDFIVGKIFLVLLVIIKKN